MVLQERYRNPSFAETDLEKWWTNVPKSLLTVGSKGVQESHLNSLVNLLGEHDRNEPVDHALAVLVRVVRQIRQGVDHGQGNTG